MSARCERSMYGKRDYTQAMRAVAMQRVGTEIREKREKAKMTLRALAKVIGVSPPFMSDVERGRRSTSKLTAIEEALNLKPGSLWKAAGLCRRCGGSGLSATGVEQFID